MEVLPKNIKKSDERKVKLFLRYDIFGNNNKIFGTEFVNTSVGHALTSFYGMLGSAKFSIQVVDIDQIDKTATL